MLTLLILACVFREPVPAADSADSAADTDGGGDVGEDQASEPGLAVVLTANEVLSAGWLATISLEDGARSDQLVETRGDAAAAIAGEGLLLLERFGGARARALDPADWSAPAWEQPVDGGPYAAAACGEALLVSRYEAGDVVALDPLSGQTLGAAAVDGSPAGLVADGGTLYVAVHRLDEESWTPLDGALIAVDCASLEQVGAWELPGPLPSVQLWPGRPGTLLVRLGAYDRQGGVYALDLAGGALAPIVREQEELGGRGLSDFAIDGSSGALLTYGEDDWQVHCLALDGDTARITDAERTPAALVDVAISPGGQAWIAARPPWDDPEGDAGLLVYDLATCTSLTGPDWFRTDEPPLRVLIAPEW